MNVGTLHAAKGLEFRAVAVVGCDDGTLPLKRALDAEYEGEAKAIALPREQQLLYVGCTLGSGEITDLLRRYPIAFFAGDCAPTTTFLIFSAPSSGGLGEEPPQSRGSHGLQGK